MRLEKKRDEEMAARKGMTGRTIVGFIWLATSAVLAYFLVTYLIEAKYISVRMFYEAGIPRFVPGWVFIAGITIFIVLLMQFFLIMGFMIASPEGRRRTGEPSLHSHTKEPFDDHGGRG